MRRARPRRPSLTFTERSFDDVDLEKELDGDLESIAALRGAIVNEHQATAIVGALGLQVLDG